MLDTDNSEEGKPEQVERAGDSKAAAPPGSLNSREDAIAWLQSAVNTPAGEMDMHSPLAQEYTQEIIRRKEDAEIIRTHVKGVNKLDALKQLCVLRGWLKDVPAGKPVDTLAELLDSIRAGEDAAS